jgi:hypothetical protein
MPSINKKTGRATMANSTAVLPPLFLNKAFILLNPHSSAGSEIL